MPTISIDARETIKLIEKLSKNNKKIAARTINDALKTGKTAAAKELGKQWNIKAGAIKKEITVKKASQSNQNGKIEFKSKPTSLINFAARQTKKGVTYKVFKKGGRETLIGGFITTTPRQGKQVFLRQYSFTTAVKKPLKPAGFYANLPTPFRKITKVTGPRLNSILLSNNVLLPIQVEIKESIIKNAARHTASAARGY